MSTLARSVAKRSAAWTIFNQPWVPWVHIRRVSNELLHLVAGWYFKISDWLTTASAERCCRYLVSRFAHLMPTLIYISKLAADSFPHPNQVHDLVIEDLLWPGQSLLHRAVSSQGIKATRRNPLRSTNDLLLAVPKTRGKTPWWPLAYRRPRIWNALPSAVRETIPFDALSLCKYSFSC